MSSGAAETPKSPSAATGVSPFEQLKTGAKDAIAAIGHNELYGIDFSSGANWGTPHERILKKFLVANKDDPAAAIEQLKKTLKWRKDFKPLSAAHEEAHATEFERLGLVTKSPSGKIITWNLYGAVKDRKSLFAALDKFLRWRVGLMERGIALLDWDSAENSYMDQVHDYMDVSFLRLDGETRKASSTIIKLFQDYYPEFLSAKYFVNVPTIMGWMFTFAKTFMSRDTTDKFHVVSNGSELKYDLGDWIPKQYGGKGPTLLEISQETARLTGEKEAATNAPTSAIPDAAKAIPATEVNQAAEAPVHV